MCENQPKTRDYSLKPRKGRPPLSLHRRRKMPVTCKLSRFLLMIWWLACERKFSRGIYWLSLRSWHVGDQARLPRVTGLRWPEIAFWHDINKRLEVGETQPTDERLALWITAQALLEVNRHEDYWSFFHNRPDLRRHRITQKLRMGRQQPSFIASNTIVLF